MTNKNDVGKIPKKIHYCWFGGAPFPESAKKCIDSWKKYCPDYEIIEWNESNINLEESRFIKEAYENKKWAFVADYARYKIIYNNGGIYLDVDVEIVRNLDDLLKYDAFMGFEGLEYVNTGLGFGAEKGNKMIKSIIEIYNTINFNAYKNNPSEIATPVLVTNLLTKNGLVKNGEFQKIGTITILPEDYLCPKNPITRLTNITDNTFSIHHYDASWVDENERQIIDNLEGKGKLISKKYPDLVSIIIPVYNGEDYLRKAINSALNQTYKNLEVLVVNDGSTDGSEEIALSYGSSIRYIKKENGGVASALNQGIKSMRGKYFSWLSHDDIYHFKKIETLIGQIKKEVTNTIVISDWDIIDMHGKFIKHCKLDDRLELAPRSFLAFDRKTWLNACAMLIPKKLFDKVGLFDEELRTTQDYDMHNRLIKNGAHFKIVHKTLFYSRQHSKQGCLIEDNVLQNSDKMHKTIINDLQFDEILQYFKSDYSEIEKTYFSFLVNGYKETPAIILNRAINAFESNNLDNQAIKLIQNELIDIRSNDSVVLAKKIMNKASAKKKKKRLLFCSGYWFTGGMERVLANLFTKLVDSYEIFLLTPYAANDGCIELPQGVMHIRMSSTLYNERFDTVALTYVLALDIDVVIGFLNLFEKQLDLYTQCRENNIKTIASNHEYYFYPYKSYDKHIRKLADKRRKVFDNLDAVLWLTNFSTAVHNIHGNNGYLMPNPNTFEIQKTVITDKKEKIILCIGRFNDYVKRIDRIIECFGLVNKKVPNAKLMLIGNADRDLKIPQLGNRSINDLIKESKINNQNIIFVNETPDISKYYAMASLFLLTSISEGFPMVLTEAACFGLPAVCNYIPGLEDIVVDKGSGFLVPQDDINSMSDAVCKLLLDDKLRLDMGESAKKHVAQFSTIEIARKWKLLLDVITSNKSSESKKQLLTRELPFQVKDHCVFEQQLFDEFNYSFNQSIDMSESIVASSEVCNYKRGRRARIKHLLRLTAREYRTNGISSTIRKMFKRIVNKTKFELARFIKLIINNGKKLINTFKNDGLSKTSKKILKKTYTKLLG